MSSLIYAIQLWGGANKSLISSLQVQQNKAARLVTKLGLRTPISTLLKQCGWLSVRQLVMYHNCLFIYKTKKALHPSYFAMKFQSNIDEKEDAISQRTRLRATGGIRLEKRANSELEQQSFTHLSVRSWNTLPLSLRQSSSLTSFKFSLKEWIASNVPID